MLGAHGVRMKHTFFKDFCCPLPEIEIEKRIEKKISVIESNLSSGKTIETEIEDLNTIVNEVYGLSVEEQIYVKSYTKK